MLKPNAILDDLLQTTTATTMVPREFFFAWSGVPTLAYRGFTKVLLDLKVQLSERVPGLKKENPGSLWPKTTLGALRDDRVLTSDEAFRLRDVCDQLNPKVSHDLTPFEVAELSLVVFACRSLERRLAAKHFPLQPRVENSGNASPAEHLAEVDATMRPFGRDQLHAYVKDLQRLGNRERHYRADYVESTLVADLREWQPAYLDEFIAAVDDAVPGAYVWFDRSSRHMTVRALLTN